MKHLSKVGGGGHCPANTTVATPLTECLACPQVARQLFGNLRAFLVTFSFVEQLSVHRATSKFLCLISHSHAPATSERIKPCRI